MSRLDMVGRVIMKDAFSKTFNDLESEAKQAESALGSLGGAMLALGATAAAGGLATAAFELTKLGAEAQTVETIFGNLTRANKLNGEELLAGLKAASRGAVAETDLMITANRALLAGGAQLASELPRLFEIARASAAATGQDIGYIFETLVKGIVKASPLLIDNAEIYLKIGDAVDNYAKSIGKSTDELTQQERQLSTLNAVLEDGGKFIEQMGLDSQTAAEDVQSLAAAWDEVQVAMGEVLVEAGVAGYFGDLADDLRQLKDGKEHLLTFSKEVLALKLAFKELDNNTPRALGLIGDIIAADAAQFVSLEEKTKRLDAVLAQLGVTVQDGLFPPHGSVWRSFTSAADDAEKEVEEVARSVKGLRNLSPITLDIDVRVGKGIDSELNRLAAAGDISFDDYIAEMEYMGAEWARIQEDMAFASQEEYQFMAESWLGMNKRRLQDTYATEEEIQKAIRDTGETYAGLEGKIKSALSIGVDVTAEDMRLTELGLYQDKALESARRLADIVNQGTASPWAATFDIPTDVLAQGEDAVKRWAAAVQRDVEDLARPDLINWDAFLANFQSQADREAAQALTIDIAVEKLSAAGLLSGSIEDKKKEVAKALGLAVPEMTIATLFKTSEDAPAQLRDEITEGKGEFHVKVKFDAPDVPPGLELLGGAQNLFTATTAKIGTDKLEMPFLPMIIKPDDWNTWVSDQVGQDRKELALEPVIAEPDDWKKWLSLQLPPDVPDFLVEPKLEVKDDTVENMSGAMITALGRSPDPMTNAGVRMGEIFLTGIDKAIDDGANDFFERMAKRLVPEIIRFLPRVGGQTPLP